MAMLIQCAQSLDCTREVRLCRATQPDRAADGCMMCDRPHVQLATNAAGPISNTANTQQQQRAVSADRQAYECDQRRPTPLSPAPSLGWCAQLGSQHSTHSLCHCHCTATPQSVQVFLASTRTARYRQATPRPILPLYCSFVRLCCQSLSSRRRLLPRCCRILIVMRV